jgi:oligopeptide transport system ATP-binding protein
MNCYPHELSGGMRQRVMIAMSIICKPEIIIADEPTTSLDVTIQSQIIDLFNEITREFNSSLILITHNMGIVSESCNRIMVMYGGKIMELGNINEVLNNPLHPYTKGLLEAIPKIEENYKELKTIKGDPINMINIPKGCIFQTRCPNPSNDCKEGNTENKLLEKEPGHWVDQCCINCI